MFLNDLWYESLRKEILKVCFEFLKENIEIIEPSG